jgi:pyruvate/2-oxoglutarate dehydrogenase complex dihydrolipoamide acyltransferase (E2) component
VEERCWILRAPRLNANDDAVVVTRWIAADLAPVRAGEPIAEIETEKATAELVAEADGVLVREAAANAKVPIGAVLAYVGDITTIEAVRRAALPMTPSASLPPASATVNATTKARTLAARHAIDLAQVAASGSTVKERDVARHLATREAAGALANDPRLVPAGEASPHQLRVARDLRAATHAGIFTTLAYRLDLRGPERMIAAELAQGRAASSLVTLLLALGKTLPAFPQLISVIDGGKVLRYRDIDIAFAVRTPAGELHAPVVRQVDRRDAAEVARECARLAKSAMRGKLAAKDVGGACFTVSLIPVSNVESFIALPPPAQTAILALGARREDTEWTASGPAPRPVATATVTYDHALCDGIYVAEFCAALDRALNAEPA